MSKDVEDRVTRAKELFMSGYNCSQAVFCAFADRYGLSEEMALRLSASFGGGLGRLRETCGAVSGMALVCGLETGCTVAGDRAGKAHNYEEVRELAAKFREVYGTICCRELLEKRKAAAEVGGIPEERTEEYYKKRPCVHTVMTAARILQERYPEPDLR